MRLVGYLQLFFFGPLVLHVCNMFMNDNHPHFSTFLHTVIQPDNELFIPWVVDVFFPDIFIIVYCLIIVYYSVSYSNFELEHRLFIILAFTLFGFWVDCLFVWMKINMFFVHGGIYYEANSLVFSNNFSHLIQIIIGVTLGAMMLFSYHSLVFLRFTVLEVGAIHILAQSSVLIVVVCDFLVALIIIDVQLICFFTILHSQKYSFYYPNYYGWENPFYLFFYGLTSFIYLIGITSIEYGTYTSKLSLITRDYFDAPQDLTSLSFIHYKIHSGLILIFFAILYNLIASVFHICLSDAFTEPIRLGLYYYLIFIIITPLVWLQRVYEWLMFLLPQYGWFIVFVMAGLILFMVSFYCLFFSNDLDEYIAFSIMSHIGLFIFSISLYENSHIFFTYLFSYCCLWIILFHVITQYQDGYSSIRVMPYIRNHKLFYAKVFSIILLLAYPVQFFNWFYGPFWFIYSLYWLVVFVTSTINGFHIYLYVILAFIISVYLCYFFFFNIKFRQFQFEWTEDFFVEIALDWWLNIDKPCFFCILRSILFFLIFTIFFWLWAYVINRVYFFGCFLHFYDLIVFFSEGHPAINYFYNVFTL